MTLEEYVNLTIKLIAAFSLPLGWAVILYPLMRKFKKTWIFLLITATMASFAFLIAKEITDTGNLFSDDIIAYSLGVFFGATALSVLFNFKNAWLRVLPEDEKKNVHQEAPVSYKRKNIHLRHLLQAAISMEERGNDFYIKLSHKVAAQEVKNLCYGIAREENSHKAFIEKMLYQWLPLALDKEAMDLIKEEMDQWNIYMNQPDMKVTEEEMARYAIEQEIRMANFFLSFERAFPNAKKRMHIDLLVMAERTHASKLIGIYPQFKAMLGFSMPAA